MLSGRRLGAVKAFIYRCPPLQPLFFGFHLNFKGMEGTSRAQSLEIGSVETVGSPTAWLHGNT